MAAKPGELRVAWSKKERDILYSYGGGGASKPTSMVIAHAFEVVEVYGGKSLRAELEARGYDLTTLKFSIRRKAVRP